MASTDPTATVAVTFIGITMALNTNARQQVDYFIGTEVENTAMKNQPTLFVVGTKPVEEIIALAEKHKIKHLYFGTSQSFHPFSPYDWAAWDEMIKPLLVKDYWVTLDFGVEYCKDLNEQSWNEYNNFIPMISVKIPYIRQYNYNATLKIDDNTWGDTNPGVWCHPLNELMKREVYTDWREYVGDTPVSPESGQDQE
jgi:hypothetical protein